MHLLDLNSINFNYDDDFHLSNINFSLNSGEAIGLFGPSGSGKSTILRIIAGLLQPSSGEIFLENNLISNLAPNMRSIGMVFQNHALFPHLDVSDNIAFGLKMQKWDKRAINQRVDILLDLFGIKSLKHRNINELSVGESQRVAIARSLAPNPKLLLMDEPFSSLDETLKIKLRTEIANILNEMKISSIVVSHDIQDIVAFSNNIALIAKGEIIQLGFLGNMYDAPKNNQVSKMLGFVSIKKIINRSNNISIGNIDHNNDAVVHPDNIQASATEEKTRWSLQSDIKKIFYHGPTARVLFSIELDESSFHLYAKWTDTQEPVIGQNAYINIYKDDIKIVLSN